MKPNASLTPDIRNQPAILQGIADEYPFLQLYRDDKTGLLWERAFFEKATRLFAGLNDSTWCVIAVDLDHFSLFNDWYGRDVGDTLLQRVGAELTKAEKNSGGLAGYLGQDDFCLAAPYDEDGIMRLYERLSGLIAELATAIGFKPVFGVSVTNGHEPFLDVFDEAKMALDYAHADYKTDICLYEPSMREREDREYRVLLDFQRGLREHEFIIHLQPQCRASSGRIIGAEVLARWRKPDGTLIPPNSFVPILEKHGFITDLDCYVWEHTCANIRAWLDSGHVAIPVSVNVSQNDFYVIDVADHFIELVKTYDLPPSLLKIEITESALADGTASVGDVVRRLREAGFTVLMDDFGSGYSSLNRLSSLDVDVIKLDADFLKMDEVGKHRGIRIVESIISMAKTMALPVICEGVETKEQLEFLESLGCRYIQGFYFYKPLPVSEFERVIGNPDNIDARGFVTKLNDQMRIREFLDENVYSDAMLNTILGPVAFYLWKDDNIDIIRFNEQFYEAVGVPDFNERMTSIQRFTPEDDIPKMFDLFERAAHDKYNGASDVIGFFRTDGTLSRFFIRLYYLGESAEGKRFYGSARDVTQIADLRIQLELLSGRLPMTIVFMRRLQGIWQFTPIVHGLADEMGMSSDDLRRELNDSSFLDRIEADALQHIQKAAQEAVEASADFFSTFTFTCGDGSAIRLKVEADRVDDNAGDASYVLIFSQI